MEGYSIDLTPKINTADTIREKLKVECVIVCVRYSDFLSHSLLFSKRHFDKLVVVTANSDWHTQQVCKYHNVKCIKTDLFDKSFNKAGGINLGLKSLDLDGWVVHMDADIALPPHTRDAWERAALDPTCIYGIDRMMCPNPESWFNYISEPTVPFEDNIYIHTGPFPIGTRIAKKEYGGHVPIGFYQQWFPKVSKVYNYPEHHEDAARADMLHSLRWTRDKRLLIPEIIGIHLATQDYTDAEKTGMNWQGRTSKGFFIDDKRES